MPRELPGDPRRPGGGLDPSARSEPPLLRPVARRAGDRLSRPSWCRPAWCRPIPARGCAAGVPVYRLAGGRRLCRRVPPRGWSPGVPVYLAASGPQVCRCTPRGWSVGPVLCSTVAMREVNGDHGTHGGGSVPKKVDDRIPDACRIDVQFWRCACFSADCARFHSLDTNSFGRRRFQR